MAATQASTLLPVEKEAFWKNHYAAQQASGLQRIDYCRQHHLSYDCFGYWVSKWRKKNDKKPLLIPVKLKASLEPVTFATLCTIDLGRGRCLTIHDTRALSVILDKWG